MHNFESTSKILDLHDLYDLKSHFIEAVGEKI